MHPIVIYELVKARTDLDRDAERRRLAQAEMPRVPRAPASRRPLKDRWPSAISFHLWIRVPSHYRSQPSPDRREPPPAGGPAGSVRPGPVRSLQDCHQGGSGKPNGELAGALIVEPRQGLRRPPVEEHRDDFTALVVRTDPVAGRVAAAGHRDHGKEG